MSKALFLFGNGLSIGLSTDFSLRTITSKFLEQLPNQEKLFFEKICGKTLNFEDFEENFSRIEDALEGLLSYVTFLNSDAGKTFLENFSLSNPELEKHYSIIQKIYDNYIFQILQLIQGNVTKKGISEKLAAFSSFLKKELDNSEKGYVFTLNYDLLAETILLEELGTTKFTDFCSSAGNHAQSKISKFDFDPAMNNYKFGEYESQFEVELHHLHGSLSLFIDGIRNKAIKFRNEEILLNDIYGKIAKENWDLRPAIITGGGKSKKVNQYPFEFYYRNLKDLCTYAKFNKLYIVGYSFRDEHINKLLKRWISAVEKPEDGILIVDFKNDDEAKKDFIKFVKISLKLRRALPSSCFEFGGANSIRSISGTIPKPKD